MIAKEFLSLVAAKKWKLPDLRLKPDRVSFMPSTRYSAIAGKMQSQNQTTILFSVT